MNLRFRMLHKPTDWRWVCSLVPLNESEDNIGLVGIDISTELPVAVLVLEDVTKNSAQAHFAVSDPLAFKHGFLEELCAFMFEGMKLDHVYGYIKSDNLASLSVASKIGFKEVYLMENAVADGIHYHVMKMQREECNYLEDFSHGQK